LLDSAYSLLKEHNLRITPQRRAILKILYDASGHHLEAENIYNLLVKKKEKKVKVGLATVYRTMDLFHRIGLVLRLQMEGSPARYELVLPDKGNHHHLICLGCCRVQEIDDYLAGDFKRKIYQQKGFYAFGEPIKVFGYCSNCSSNCIGNKNKKKSSNIINKGSVENE
jgi:Fur family ferric uptake transcriptional regulator